MQDYLEEVSESWRRGDPQRGAAGCKGITGKAIDIKGLGPVRKAEIRKKYKKAMEEKEHGRKTGVLEQNQI